MLTDAETVHDAARERRRTWGAPSMADVAVRAGVSAQTVSRVLNDHAAVRPETRERVLTAVAELGYRRNRAARALAMSRSHRIGMISANLTLHGPRAIATAVERAGYAAGYETAVIGLPELSEASLAATVNRLLEESVEAVVIAVAHRESLALTQALVLDVPLVIVEGVEEVGTMVAGVDQVAGAAAATSHLLELGRGPVAHVSGPLDWLEAAQRRDGWLSAHTLAGGDPGRLAEEDWTPGGGYAAGLKLGRASEVGAIFVANDSMALGVLKALDEVGRRVPEDVAVVGFDDIPEAAYFRPSLTSVRQDFDALGRTAVSLALRALDGEATPTAELIVPTLQIRGSSRG